MPAPTAAPRRSSGLLRWSWRARRLAPSARCATARRRVRLGRPACSLGPGAGLACWCSLSSPACAALPAPCYLPLPPCLVCTPLPSADNIPEEARGLGGRSPTGMDQMILVRVSGGRGGAGGAGRSPKPALSVLRPAGTAVLLRPARSPWLGAALTALPADLLCLPGPTPPQRWRTRGCTTSVPAGLPRSTTPSECPAGGACQAACPPSQCLAMRVGLLVPGMHPGQGGREGARVAAPTCRCLPPALLQGQQPAGGHAGGGAAWPHAAVQGLRRVSRGPCGPVCCCRGRQAHGATAKRCAHAQPLSLPSSPWPACLSSTCRRKGATLGCFKRTCRASYHLACARKYNCLLQVRAVRAWHGGRESERG